MAATLKPKLESQMITVEAALSGSRKLFVQALLADGCVSDPVTAERLADDLLHAQKQSCRSLPRSRRHEDTL